MKRLILFFLFFIFIQIGFSAINTTSGIFLEFENVTSLNYEKSISQIDLISDLIIKSSNSNLDNVEWEVSFNISNFNNNYYLQIFDVNISNNLCNSTSSLTGTKSCVFNYDESYISSIHNNLSYRICISSQLCSSPYSSFTFQQLNYIEQIQGGIYLLGSKNFNETIVNSQNSFSSIFPFSNLVGFLYFIVILFIFI